jgi:hypothetical protein
MNIRHALAASAIALAAIAVLPSAASASTNLLVNGSFETGNFSGWTLSGPANDGYPATVIKYNNPVPYPNGAFGEAIPTANAATLSPDPAGNFAAYFVSDASNQTLSQTTYLTVGTYNIGFSAYVPFNGQANPVNAYFAATVGGDPIVSFLVGSETAGNWVNYTGVADITTAGNYQTAFTFQTPASDPGVGQGEAKDVVIDQVYLTATSAVPEPATWAMFLLGFGSIGFMMRGARRKGAAASA